MIVIGPLTNINTGLIGGATISFGYLINYLKQAKENHKVINTQFFSSGLKRLFNPVYILVKVLSHVFSADVIFLNSSRGGTKYLAPLLYAFAKIFRLKFVFRPFGGDLKDYTDHYSVVQKWLFHQTVLKADILFLQTKELLHFYENTNANIIHFPTSRLKPMVNLLRGEREYSKRFIYLGFVNESKGIDQILEAVQQLDTSYTVHVYGPIKEEKYQEKLNVNKGIYQGVIEKDKVLTTLCNYDVLILPTYYEGEGYPGSILEAYSLGLPVISTKWKAIPEVVENQKTGLLIDPQSTDQLVNAMQHFEKNNYSEYSKNALDYFNRNFNTDQVTERAMTQIKNLFSN